MNKRSPQMRRLLAALILSAGAWGAAASSSSIYAQDINITVPGASVGTGSSGSTVVGGSTVIQAPGTGVSGQQGTGTAGQQGQTARPTATPAAGSNRQTAKPTPTPAAGQAGRPANPKDACGNQYVPFVARAEWKYEVTGEEDMRFTRTIVRVSGNMATVEDVFTEPADEDKRTDQWQCRNGAIVMTSDAAWGTVEAGGTSTRGSMKSEGVTLPANPKPGDTWSQTTRISAGVQAGGQNIGAEVQIKESCRAVRMESVTVPAGKFNALRVDCTEETTTKANTGANVPGVNINVPGVNVGSGSVDVSGTSKRTDWYAASVGLVKSKSEDSEKVLVSYRIP